MAPTTSFTADITIKGQAALERMRDRLMDFAQPFHEIILSWQAHEKEKFAEAEGREMTGVSFDDGHVYWDPVTEKYHSRKLQQGYADHRMVLTGETMASLTDPGHPDWFERVEPLYALFGSIHPLVLIHWQRSPTAFLDQQDRASIERELFDWLSGLPPYAPLPKTITIERASGVTMEGEDA